MGYVIGLNEVFEPSQHDVEQGSFSGPRRPIEGARGTLDEGLPWQGPILPASEQGTLDNVGGGSRTGRQTAAKEACSLRSSVLPTGESRDRFSHDDGPTVAVASLPAISAVSAFGLIAGWFWSQRKRWERFRSARTGRTDH